ncbi:uncharacterized protein LOC135145367 [Zophobas morio]|uniref:uncharacterized protein LOC135145367 n=1 Tax=Zophobas morio TaxID=2755281 RepID=UPI0030839BAB
METFLKHVLPGLGALTSSIMYGSSIPGVYKARKLEKFNEMNPLTYVSLCGYSFSWLIYGFSQEPFNFYLIACSFFELFSISCTCMLLPFLRRKPFIEYVCICHSIIFYAAPFSRIIKIIKEMNSIYVYLPLAFANLVDLSLWMAWGAVEKDWLFVIPCCIGAFCAVCQIVVGLVIPRKSLTNKEEKDTVSNVGNFLTDWRKSDS